MEAFAALCKEQEEVRVIMIKLHLNSMKNAPRIKFGVRIPRNNAYDMYFDRKNDNMKWADAEKLYLNQIYKYG